MRTISIGALGLAVLAARTNAQVTQRASVSNDASGANFDSFYAAISSDGRFVAFETFASNLVPGDTNQDPDVFVRDRWNGTTERVSVDSGGSEADGQSRGPSMSADGRLVAFWSTASNLVPGDTNNAWDIFVRDRSAGTTERVNVSTAGTQAAGGSSMAPSLSPDGRYVVFESSAINLVPAGTNGLTHVYVRDRQAGTTELVSVDSSGQHGDYGSHLPSISADGRYVAFESYATNLVAGDTNGTYDVFVHDRVSGATERVSVDSSGVGGDERSQWSAISADGRCVAFWGFAANLVPGDTNLAADIFLRDRIAGTTERVSLGASGLEANADSWDVPSISPDGRRVAFVSFAANLVPGDTNGRSDIFVRDRESGTTERVSLSTNGREGDDECSFPSMTADTRFVGFVSLAGNLVPGDANLLRDVFVHDRDATSFTSLCEPGLAGTSACPCANPPASAGRGCDNSAGTGGAALLAHGIAYLSMDGLVFRTSRERPGARSLLVQGNAQVASGVAYGQGVRCAGGRILRLFAKIANGGTLVAPDFVAGDPTISARSAALGDVIQPGQSRWYAVFYRDPVVLGGCAASSTFNATQTGQVSWSL